MGGPQGLLEGLSALLDMVGDCTGIQFVMMDSTVHICFIYSSVCMTYVTFNKITMNTIVSSEICQVQAPVITSKALFSETQGA